MSLAAGVDPAHIVTKLENRTNDCFGVFDTYYMSTYREFLHSSLRIRRELQLYAFVAQQFWFLKQKQEIVYDLVLLYTGFISWLQLVAAGHQAHDQAAAVKRPCSCRSCCRSGIRALALPMR